MFQKSSVSPDPAETSVSTVQMKGHHPDCEEYSANRITVGEFGFLRCVQWLVDGGNRGRVGGRFAFFRFFGSGTGSLWVLAAGEGLMLVGLALDKDEQVISKWL